MGIWVVINMYNKNKTNKLFYNDLPNEIKTIFSNSIKYDIDNNVLYLKRYGKTQIISNVNSMYYYDDDFYIESSSLVIIIWVDIQTWNVIKKGGKK